MISATQRISKGLNFTSPALRVESSEDRHLSDTKAKFSQTGVVIRCERVLTDMSQDQWGSVCYLVASLLFAVWWRLRVEDEMRHQEAGTAYLVSMNAPGAVGQCCCYPWYAWKSLLLQAIKTTAIRRRTSFFIGPANPFAFELEEAMSELPLSLPECLRNALLTIFTIYTVNKIFASAG
jgi:hypothetical protein